jgi:glycosyltransferase involved in cell wall biosynthesis
MSNDLGNVSWSLRFWYLRDWLDNKKNLFLLKVIRIAQVRRPSDHPLISVVIPTYNRGRLLCDRAISSVLRQTYQNFEIVIVGDNCTDNTNELLRNIDDKRIRFYNLSKRGNYPADPKKRWLVAGVVPANKCLKLARGEWIASLDDDDEFSPDHLEVLFEYAQRNKFEMVYGVVQMEKELGKMTNVGTYPLQWGYISRMATLYSSKLKFFKYDINAWRIEDPADWNLWRRMKSSGVKIGFINHVVGIHYLERTNQANSR